MEVRGCSRACRRRGVRGGKPLVLVSVGVTLLAGLGTKRAAQQHRRARTGVSHAVQWWSPRSATCRLLASLARAVVGPQQHGSLQGFFKVGL